MFYKKKKQPLYLKLSKCYWAPVGFYDFFYSEASGHAQYTPVMVWDECGSLSVKKKKMK